MSFFARYKPPGPLKPKANPYPSRISSLKQKPLRLIGTFFIGAAILCASSFLYEPTRPLLFELTTFIHTAFTYPLQKSYTLLGDAYSLIELKNKHAQLLEENEKLKWRVQNLEAFYHENISLKKALNVPFVEPYRHTTVRILASPYDGIHYFFLLAAGARDGLVKDQAVVSSEGVIGRVEKVGQHVTRVLLLTDVNSRIPVRTELSAQKAILAGEGGAFPTLVYVTDFQKIKLGERIVTSGVGGIFPPGLPVGHVVDIAPDKIQVQPFAFYQNLEWVYVLHPQPATLSEEVRMQGSEE